MPSNKFYLLLGIDRVSPVSTCLDGLWYGHIYDLDSSAPDCLVRKYTAVRPVDITGVALGDLMSAVIDDCRRAHGKTLGRIKIFYGDGFSSASQIANTMAEDSRFTLEVNDGHTFKFAFNNGTKRDTKITLQASLPQTFTFRNSKGGLFTADFDRLIKSFCEGSSIHDLCTKTWTVLRDITRLMKKAFTEEDITPTTLAGDQALMELDYNMNIGGRTISTAESHGKVKKFMSFDINSSYTTCLLEEEFSTRYLFHMNRLEPFRRAVNRFTPENREVSINALLDSSRRSHMQYRVVLRTNKGLVVRPDKEAIGIPFNKRNACPDVTIKYEPHSNRVVSILGSFTICVFIEELKLIYENYVLADDFEMVDVLYTTTKKLSKKIREAVLKTYLDVERKKSEVERLNTIGAKLDDIMFAKKCAERLKITKNNAYGFFGYFGDMKATMSRNSSWSYDPAAVCGLAKKHQELGHMLRPLVGSEVALKGREAHRRLEKFFTDRGFNVFYGNTDSIYVEYNTEEERNLLLDTWKEFNDMMAKKFNSSIRDLTRYPDKIHKGSLPGCIKKEKEGYCIHFGVNQVFISDTEEVKKKKLPPFTITTTSFSGVRAADLMWELRGSTVYDIHSGDSFCGVQIN